MRAWRWSQSTVCREGGARRALSRAPIQCRDSIASRLAQDADAQDTQVDSHEDIEVEGWVRSARKQKTVAFAAISDGSTIDSLQAVFPPEDAAHLSPGTAVRLHGQWKPSRGSKQSRELHVRSLQILGANHADSSPLQPKYQSPEYLRTIPHLRARIPSHTLLLRLRSQLIAALTAFFATEDFVQCHTPIITSSDCEGAGEVFAVATTPAASSPRASGEEEGHHFFRSPKYLTVSAQLHLEALALAVKKVWTLSPTFRAEASETPRHLSEFYMLEAEVAFTRDLNDVMDLVERMLKATVTQAMQTSVWAELLRSKAPSAEGEVDAETLRERWERIISPSSWPRITYREAISLLESAHATNPFTFPPSYANGLHAEHERYLASTLGRGSPVFVTHYPRAQKPFYMLPSSSSSTNASPGSGSPEDDETVSCFDLLVPDLCELVGGSMRSHDLAQLEAAMAGKGVLGGGLEWYKDLRRYGSVPHGGFGLGFDRLVAYLAGVASVKDVVAFPRWVGRCEC